MFNHLTQNAQEKLNQLNQSAPTLQDIKEAVNMATEVTLAKNCLQDLIQTITNSCAIALDQPNEGLNQKEIAVAFYQIAEINKAIINLDFTQGELANFLIANNQATQEK